MADGDYHRCGHMVIRKELRSKRWELYECEFVFEQGKTIWKPKVLIDTYPLLGQAKQKALQLLTKD